MKPKILVLLIFGISLASCGGGGDGTSSGNNPTPTPSQQAMPTPVPEDGNYVHIQMTPGSSSACSASNGYDNAPCISVTVCDNANNCDTVDNVLVDSGSYGLRIFKSQLPNTASSLTPMMMGGQQIAECVSYADGTSNWGPIEYGTVTLNSTSTTSAIPIQILDSGFPGMNSVCQGAVQTPADFQLNGIIGIGPLPSDQNTSARYFRCNSSGSCTLASPPEYLPNPITMLGSGNNNGVALTFGPIAQGGVINADGYAVFGIGSESSNTPSSGASIFKIASGIYPVNITTTFQGAVYDSFLDTGSNFFYFTTAFLTTCSDGASFCPSGFTDETATMTGHDGSGNSSNALINFTIGNAASLFGSTNTAFSTIGYYDSGLGSNIIDWGMPFFYGKTVYIVFASSTTTNIGNITLEPSNNGYWIY